MIDQILGHYRIIEMIGEGGMGTVYRARDTQLDRDVALKVLHSSTWSEAARTQFRQEALALARLNHPNIETIFEFNTQDGIDFLAMELLPGASLSAKLMQGPFAEKEIIRQGIQLAEGLTVAHEQGIVHRDLKPGNLFITPTGRLKILDFGLATMVDPNRDVNLTQSTAGDTGTASGTLPYMAPEQLRGQPTDARSDIYSAGTVLYEMATGRRAFSHQQPLLLISSILENAPQSISSINPSLSASLQAVITKALDKDPSRRYQTARELQVALEGIATGLASPSFPVTNKNSKGSIKRLAFVLKIVVVGTVLVLGSYGLYKRIPHKPKFAHGSNSASIKLRPAVAVMGFKNLSGRKDEAWLSTALSEMLTTEVSAGEKLRAIPGEDVAKMKIDLELADADSYGQETLKQIRRNTDSDYVVIGSYLALGNGQVRLDLRLENTNSGELLQSLSNRGTESDLDDLVSRVGAKLRGELGAGEVTTAEAIQLKASRPSNSEAARLYAEGLAKLRKFDNLAARDLLERAIAVDPNFANAHSELASLYDTQGYRFKAKAEAQKALSLSKDLSSEDRMVIEARFYVTNTQYEKAAETYRTLWNLYPDNIAYALHLASALNSGGKPNDSLVVIAAVRKLPPPENQNPLIDIMEAVTAGSLGDFKREQAVAAIAVGKAKNLGSRLLTADALYTEGWALSGLGENKQAMEVAEQSRDLYAALGDPEGSKSLTLIGTLLGQKGDLEGALQAYSLFYRLAQEKGDVEGMGDAQNDMASVLVSRGDLTKAAKSFSQARATFHEVRNQDSEGYALVNLSAVLFEQGQLTEADKSAREALDIFRVVGDKDGLAYAFTNEGNTLDGQGDLAGAKISYEKAQAISGETHDKNIAAHILDGLAAIAVEQGNVDDAQKQLLDAGTLWDKLGVKLSAAETRMAAADVCVDLKNATEAKKFLVPALEEFENEKATDDLILGHTILANSFLVEGKVERARKEINSVAGRVQKTENVVARFRYAIALSRIRAQSGHHLQAEAGLNLVRRQASEAGMISYVLTSRLTLAEIKIKAGDIRTGRADLASVQHDANAHGYILIARKAADSMKL